MYVYINICTHTNTHIHIHALTKQEFDNHSPESPTSHVHSCESTPIFQRNASTCVASHHRILEDQEEDDEYELDGGWEGEKCLNDFFAAIAEGDVQGVRASLDRWALEGDEADLEGNRCVYFFFVGLFGNVSKLDPSHTYECMHV
jgi:hypothetical protein